MPELSAAAAVPGDLIGGITHIVVGAVGEATSGAVNAFSAFLWQAGLEILHTGIGLADNSAASTSTSPPAHSRRCGR